jgi:hypothetical protein
MTAEPGNQAEPRPLVPRPAAPPAAFTAEVSAAVRYERGLAVKAVIVLAALAVILVLRALYFS